jgi:hypothetical protein
MVLEPAFWIGVWVGAGVILLAVLMWVLLSHEAERDTAQPFPIYQPGIREEN